MFLQIIPLCCFIVTLITGILDTLMLWFYMCQQISVLCCFIITLITGILDTLMYWFDVCQQTTLFSCFVILIPRSLGYCYMSLGGYRGRRIHGKLLPASAQQIRAIMWMYYKSQGSALIVQGSQIRGQSRHCRGSSDTFFHEDWSPRGPAGDIEFVPAQIGI